MDNWLEYIGPVILAAIYFFGNKFVKGQEEGDAPHSPRTRPTPEDPEVAERQRRIQEEIRRKIMARRQASERGESAAPAAARGPVTAYDEQLRKRREASEARRLQREEPVKQITPPPVRREVEPPAIEKAEQPSAGFSWDESDNAYESQMQQQLKQIEATKRKAAQLKKQAAATRVSSKRQSRSRSSRTFSGPVRSQLRDPAAARAALIYGEVLGPPVSMRRQSSVPGLS